MLKSKFIANILELLLDGDKEGINAKSQLEYLSESDYEYTGSGVFIGFVHKSGIVKYKADKSDLILNGVGIKSTELEIDLDNYSYAELKDYLGNLEKNYIANRLLESNGSVNSAAKSINITRTALHNKVKKYKINLDDIRVQSTDNLAK